MSGGHFDYNQFRVREIAEDIERVISTNDDQTLNEWGETKGRNYPPEIIEKFKEAAHNLERAADMAQRVDWLLSGDDGPDNFLSRWDEEVRSEWANPTGQQPEGSAAQDCSDNRKRRR